MISIFLVMTSMLTACSSMYQITLINNRQIITNSKPKLNKETNNFVYKIHNGESREISKGRVLKIEPYDGDNTGPFRPQIQ